MHDLRGLHVVALPKLEPRLGGVLEPQGVLVQQRHSMEMQYRPFHQEDAPSGSLRLRHVGLERRCISGHAMERTYDDACSASVGNKVRNPSGFGDGDIHRSGSSKWWQRGHRRLPVVLRRQYRWITSAVCRFGPDLVGQTSRYACPVHRAWCTVFSEMCQRTVSLGCGVCGADSHGIAIGLLPDRE